MTVTVTDKDGNTDKLLGITRIEDRGPHVAFIREGTLADFVAEIDMRRIASLTLKKTRQTQQDTEE